MSDYASTNDLIARWRPLTADEISLAAILLTDASNALRIYAIDRGMDLDEMVTTHPGDDASIIAQKTARAGLVKAVTCDVVKREMCSNTDDPAMSQLTQSALGYSVSGTFLTPGGGLFIKNAELKLIGLLRQKVKAVSMYE